MMLAMVWVGGTNIAAHGRYELDRVPETFDPRTFDALARLCTGHAVGYFTPYAGRERAWYEPVVSGWAALTGARVVRLSKTREDEEGLSMVAWQDMPPSAYAAARRTFWRNTSDMSLGFARAYGVDLVIESPGHPLPVSVRHAVAPIGQAGSFRLYRIKRVQHPRRSAAQPAYGNPGDSYRHPR